MSHLYVLWSPAGLLKIGRSGDPAARMAQLSGAYAGPLTLVAEHRDRGEQEGYVHSRLRRHRVMGEWFDDTPAARAATERAVGIRPGWPRSERDAAARRRFLADFENWSACNWLANRTGKIVRRLKAAAEGNRMLDADVHNLLTGGIVLVTRDESGATDCREDDGTPVPRYTTDLGAALTLAPHGGGTPPLAVCIAILEARRRAGSS